MYTTLAENFLHPVTVSRIDRQGPGQEEMHIMVTFENA